MDWQKTGGYFVVDCLVVGWRGDLVRDYGPCGGWPEGGSGCILGVVVFLPNCSFLIVFYRIEPGSYGPVCFGLFIIVFFKLIYILCTYDLFR